MSATLPGPRRPPAGWAACLGALGLALGLAAASGAARAQPGEANRRDAQRAQVLAERGLADRRLADDAAACMGRFLLTACMDAAQVRHRRAVALLDQRQQLLDSAARQARAARRRQGLGAAAAGPASSAAPAVNSAAQEARGVAAPVGRSGPKLAPAPANAPMPRLASAAEAQQRAQQKAAAHALRLQSAQAHRDAVLSRVQREDAHHPPARPLPVPLPLVQGASAPGAPAAGRPPRGASR